MKRKRGKDDVVEVLNEDEIGEAVVRSWEDRMGGRKRKRGDEVKVLSEAGFEMGRRSLRRRRKAAKN